MLPGRAHKVKFAFVRTLKWKTLRSDTTRAAAAGFAATARKRSALASCGVIGSKGASDAAGHMDVLLRLSPSRG